MVTADPLVRAARLLAERVGALRFPPPVAHVYNPIQYAWTAHCAYLTKFGQGPKRVLFLGMNPGPFGMMQTGVPFGEIAAVRDWMGVTAEIRPPAQTHPKRPVEGFECRRSEVSGRRLWGLFAARFTTAQNFFTDHFVANYCPLAFLDEGGRNLTPDKFARRETERLFAACDTHLRSVVEAIQPAWVIGVGDFADHRARGVLDAAGVRFGKILHPSPASPAANRGWAGLATQQLMKLGVWTPGKSGDPTRLRQLGASGACGGPGR